MDDCIIHISSWNANIYCDLIPKCLALFEDGFAATVPTFNKGVILEELNLGTQDWYVLVRGEEPISIAIYHPAYRARKYNSVWSVCTLSTYRRMGYARKLLAHIREARPDDDLFIQADTAALGEFYMSLGYNLLVPQHGQSK
jgi:hypothetical protein